MSVIKPFLNQNYDHLRAKAIAAGVLYRDELFPADDTSISLIRSNKKPYKIFWKRPHQIVDNPKFIVNDINPNDLVQGDTGNCWFLSALSALAMLPNFCQLVIPPTQTFDMGYAGIFHFRFWKFGEWVDVVIDDRLPVNERNELIYCHNYKDKNEFFGPLLEKAYAKLACCYEFLNSGDPTVAMTDLTGAVCETFSISRCLESTLRSQHLHLHDEKFVIYDDDKFGESLSDLEALWIVITNSYYMNSLMSVSMNNRHASLLDSNGHLPNGLIPNHSYSLIQAVEFKVRANDSRPIRLIKLRNPQGDIDSWKGDWGRTSSLWHAVDAPTRDIYKLKLNSNGEFYISFKDFVTQFEELDVAHVNLDAFASYSSTFSMAKTHWGQKQFYGSWHVVGDRSQGQSLHDNPQYLLEINHNQPMSSLIVSLLQPYSARLRYENNGSFDNSFKPIKFNLYRVNDAYSNSADMYEHKTRFRKFKENQMTLIDKPYFLTQRDFTKRFALKSGYYVIVPCTLDRSIELNYLLRIFHDQSTCSFIRELAY